MNGLKTEEKEEETSDYHTKTTTTTTSNTETTITTTIEGDRIDSVEDYTVENSTMEQDHVSSTTSSHTDRGVVMNDNEQDYEQESKTEEEDEPEAEEDDDEEYERNNYSREPPKYNADQKVFEAKMQNILQEMKMKEIIRDKSGGVNSKATKNNHATNSRPLSASSDSSKNQRFDHTYNNNDNYENQEDREEEEVTVEEEVQITEIIKEDKNNLRVSAPDDRESSVQYEFEPEIEDSNLTEPEPQATATEFSYEEQLSESMTLASEESDAHSRLIYNEVPTMNSKTNDSVNFVQEQVQTLKLNEEPKVKITYLNNHPATSFYNNNNNNIINNNNKSNNSYANNTEAPVAFSPTYPTPAPMKTSSQNMSISRSRPLRPIYQSSAKLSNQNASPQYNSTSTMHYPVRRTCSPREEPTSPTRNIIHIGSQVISEQSGPSLTISLRRPNSERPWGFSFFGGAEHGCPPFVNKVSLNGLAYRGGVEVGDVIVSICNSLTVGKTYEQVKAEMLRAGNELDLILIRRGVDINKVAQVAPQVMATSSFSQQPSFDTDSINQRKISTRSLTRGHSFRPIQTKSLRILEQQLSISETTGCPVVKVRQVTNEPRVITTPGYNGSFSNTYGQNFNSQTYQPNRQIKPQQLQQVTMTAVIHPTHNPQVNQTQHNSYECNRTSYNVSPSNQWVTTQPIQLWNAPVNSGYNNTSSTITTKFARPSYERNSNSTNWVKAVPANQYGQNDYYAQNTYVMNSYSEQRDASSTRSVPIYPTSYSPYRN
ncbi:unnamed protein product [Trichobilharzia szidati]|nr:unnamed protein product [Trichobilharzia szidati]